MKTYKFLNPEGLLSSSRHSMINIDTRKLVKSRFLKASPLAVELNVVCEAAKPSKCPVSGHNDARSLVCPLETVWCMTVRQHHTEHTVIVVYTAFVFNLASEAQF